MKDSIKNTIIDACSNKNKSFNESVADIRNAANEIAISRCSNPREMLVTDRHTSIARRTFVPCGRCYHCLETRSNEWVTRMWHECCAFGENTHVYFITLTYNGFSLYNLIPNFLLNAYWRKDNINSTKSSNYRPCLCRFEHFAHFVRLFRKHMLQKFNDFEFSYVACCEYGHTYGAPHFHAILFTSHEVSFNDINRGWSYNSGTRKFPQYHSIGRIQIVDLKKNGTLVGTKDLNARKCFAYVAKYMYKQELPKSARIHLFYEDIQHNKIDFHTLTQIFDSNTCLSATLKRYWYDYYIKSTIYQIQNDAFTHSIDLDECFKHMNLTNILNYHDEDYVTSLQDAKNFAPSMFVESLVQMPKPIIFELFKSSVRVSHSHAIGANYINRNIKEHSLLELKYDKAPFGKLVVPRYYVKRIAQYWCPLQSVHQSSLGGSSTPSLVQLEQVSYFSQYLYDGNFLAIRNNFIHPDILLHFDNEYRDKINDYQNPFNLNIVYPPLNISEILHSNYAFRDSRTGCRGFITFGNTLYDYHVYWYTYNRNSKSYDFVYAEHLTDFADFVIKSYEFYSTWKNNLISQSLKSFDDFNDMSFMVQEFFERYSIKDKNLLYFINECKSIHDYERTNMNKTYWTNKCSKTKKTSLI